MRRTWYSRAAIGGLLLTMSLRCGRTGLHGPAPDAQPADGGRAEGLRGDGPADAAFPADDARRPADTLSPPSAWLESCRKRLSGVALGTSSDVQTLAVGEDDTVYLAGYFTRVGPGMGGGVSFPLLEGQPAVEFDRVAGDVYAVVGDGSGGWFIGGAFDHVGALPRKNLAHVGADGRADASFQADADERVSALALLDDRVYVGGDFSTVGGVARGGLAAVDRRGKVTAWAADVETVGNGVTLQGSVYALLAIGSRLFVGGKFTTIAGAPRSSLAVFERDGTIGLWDPQVQPRPQSADRCSVLALAGDAGGLWIGGDFDTVSGFSHRAIAAFDASGKLRDWDPELAFYNRVGWLALGPDILYVSGDISSVGPEGKATERYHLAAFDRSGALLPWYPTVDNAGPGLTQTGALAVVGDTVYIAGAFTSVAGVPRLNLAAVDTSGRVLDWDPQPDGMVQAFAIQGDTLYAGGRQRTLCGHERMGLAALDADGRLRDWNPSPDRAEVRVATLTKSSLLVGGGFFSLGGQDRRMLGEVDLVSGRATAWAPGYGNWITFIQPFGDVIYVGGGDASLPAGMTPANLAAFSPSGSRVPWDSGSDFTRVGPAAVLGDVLYVGGKQYPGPTAGKLAAWDKNGTCRAWNPTPDGEVYTLLADEANGRLFVGGAFQYIADAERDGLAAFDRSGNLLPWTGDFGEPPVFTQPLAMLGDRLLVLAGLRSTGIFPTCLVALDRAGRPTLLDLDFNGGLGAIEVHDGIMYAGGSFTFIDGHYASGFAKIER